MVRANGANPEDITQICFGIDTRTFRVVPVLGCGNGSYTLGEGSYGNKLGHDLETEVKLNHGYIAELICMRFDPREEGWFEEVESRLEAMAQKMKEAASG
jgi:hypothetical protein